VNVSSIHKNHFYPTPQLKNILNATDQLYLELALNWDEERDSIHYDRVMENLETIRESLILHTKEIYGMEQALMAEASTRLTDKQRLLLQWLTEEYPGDMVYTVLIERIADEFEIPKSTVRWNLRGLREAGLIVAGDKKNKGIPVSLTGSGQTLADYLSP
jgi:DNA-binding MarR family transcriptional regulator